MQDLKKLKQVYLCTKMLPWLVHAVVKVPCMPAFIYRHIVNFVAYIQDGITIENNGRSGTITGTVTLVSGDNLASHYLGGYKAPSGALRKCRQCMATSDDMQTKVDIQQ